jgi:hypothetical protein
MRRGEVWWAQLPSPAGRRPVVLLSRDTAYRVRSAVTVAPVTRTFVSCVRHDPIPSSFPFLLFSFGSPFPVSRFLSPDFCLLTCFNCRQGHPALSKAARLIYGGVVLHGGQIL